MYTCTCVKIFSIPYICLYYITAGTLSHMLLLMDTVGRLCSSSVAQTTRIALSLCYFCRPLRLSVCLLVFVQIKEARMWMWPGSCLTTR